MDEVVAPDVVLAPGPQAHARPIIEPQPTPLRLPLRHLQALPPPEPLDPLMVDGEPLGPQRGRDPPVAVPAVLGCQLDHPPYRPLFVVGDEGRAPLRRAGLPQDL